MSEMGTEWQQRAACRDEDPELFFPVSEMGPGARQVRQAKRICASCPVQAECLAYAQRNGLDFGIFGGATPEERRKTQRRADTTRISA